jgi:hypothetical protein
MELQKKQIIEWWNRPHHTLLGAILDWALNHFSLEKGGHSWLFTKNWIMSMEEVSLELFEWEVSACKEGRGGRCCFIGCPTYTPFSRSYPSTGSAKTILPPSWLNVHRGIKPRVWLSRWRTEKIHFPRDFPNQRTQWLWSVIVVTHNHWC